MIVIGNIIGILELIGIIDMIVIGIIIGILVLIGIIEIIKAPKLQVGDEWVFGEGTVYRIDKIHKYDVECSEIIPYESFEKIRINKLIFKLVMTKMDHD